jgi:hypothetical protein
VSSAAAGRVGYRSGVNATRFAIMFTLFSDVDEALTSVGTAGAKTSSAVSGRRAENSVREARGSRLGRRGMVRMWMKRRVRHWLYAGEESGNVDNGAVVRDAMNGRDSDLDFVSMGWSVF